MGEKKAKVVLGMVAIVAALVGLALLAASEGTPPGLGEGGPAAFGFDSDRGCRPDEGSSKPYPPSGLLKLSKEEQELVDHSVPFAAAALSPNALGTVTVANEDALPATALFVDEDGRPAKKAFVRGGENLAIELPSGAYDVMAQGGQDWSGERFGACSTSQKVKGIVVVEPGKGSHVVLYGELAFVLGNRLDPEASRRMLSDEKATRAKMSAQADEAVKAARPDREDRP